MKTKKLQKVGEKDPVDTCTYVSTSEFENYFLYASWRKNVPANNFQLTVCWDGDSNSIPPKLKQTYFFLISCLRLFLFVYIRKYVYVYIIYTGICKYVWNAWVGLLLLNRFPIRKYLTQYNTIYVCISREIIISTRTYSQLEYPFKGDSVTRFLLCQWHMGVGLGCHWHHGVCKNFSNVKIKTLNLFIKMI